MKTAKLIVMYPTPVDVDLFEQRYAEEHVRRSTGGSIVIPWHRMERRAEG